MGYTWQYYDLVLIGVFTSLVAGLGIGAYTSVSPTTSTLGFCLVAVAFIGHGLFVNGPVDDPTDLTDEVETLN